MPSSPTGAATVYYIFTAMMKDMERPKREKSCRDLRCKTQY